MFQSCRTVRTSFGKRGGTGASPSCSRGGGVTHGLASIAALAGPDLPIGADGRDPEGVPFSLPRTEVRSLPDQIWWRPSRAQHVCKATAHFSRATGLPGWVGCTGCTGPAGCRSATRSPATANRRAAYTIAGRQAWERQLLVPEALLSCPSTSPGGGGGGLRQTDPRCPSEKLFSSTNTNHDCSPLDKKVSREHGTTPTAT